mmetsp:Transcript_118809/g.379002  ORF Transcript_118809/g.379002 Transcript_118809/m.379002 type:complete len:206 (+) Transcript_118809:3456-4073(+)
MPAVGSSRKRMRALPRSAIATFNFLFMPPERDEAGAFLLKFNSTFSKTSSQELMVTSRESPIKVPKRWMCSSTVSVSQSTLCCMQKPIWLRTTARSSGSQCPSTRTSPAVCASIPVKIAIVVLFPAPLCPSRQKHSPWYIVRLRPSTARTVAPAAFLKSMRKPRTLMTRFLFRNCCNCSPLSSSNRSLLPCSCSLSVEPAAIPRA